MNRREAIKLAAGTIFSWSIIGVLLGKKAPASPAKPTPPIIPEPHPDDVFPITPRGEYDIGKAIDWTTEHCGEARWDIVARAMKTMEEEFSRKANEDAWDSLLWAFNQTSV
jgi:hypothetical protein